jgi:hypothetical protein
MFSALKYTQSTNKANLRDIHEPDLRKGRGENGGPATLYLSADANVVQSRSSVDREPHS